MIAQDAAAVVIENHFRIDEFAMVFYQPVDPIRFAAFLVGSQSKNNVAVGDVTFLLKADESGGHNGIAALHVLRATAVIETVLLNEAEGVSSPVFAMGFHYIEVADEQQWFMFAASAQPNDKIFLAVVRTKNLHVGPDETGIPKALRHGFGCRSHVSHRVRGIDFDQLFKNIVSELPGGVIDLPLRSRREEYKKKE